MKPRDIKIQTGLRVPENMYNEIQKISEESGASFNSCALMLINLGLKLVHQAEVKSRRSDPHTLQDNV